MKKRSDIANTLRSIAEKLDQGRLILKQDQNETIVEFPNQMVLELKVEEEQGKRPILLSHFYLVRQEHTLC